MAITLEAIAAPGATPIAFNATSAKAFANCYHKLSTLSVQQRKAIMVEALVYSLTAAGGANYKANKAGLRQDAAVYSGALSRFDLLTGLVATAVAAGNVADATLGFNVNTILGNDRVIADTPELTQDRVIAFLFAQLGI